VPPILFVVDRRGAGQTLPAILKLRFGIPWAQAKRLVERGHIKVSGQVEKDVARRVKLGKRVEVAPGTIEVKTATLPGAPQQKKEPPKPVEKVKPSAKPRAASKPAQASNELLPPNAIVYQDEDVVVVNKPAGLTTMRHAEETAEFGARAKKFLPKTLADLLPAALGTPNRPVIAVHRLDRDTSGLIVFARTRAAADDLMRQFRKHTTERRYLALTRGAPTAKRIESVLVPDRGDGRRGSTTDLVAEDGKRAVTHVAVVEQFGSFALVECRLETGRTHQVRIHLGEAGAPLCGETVYDRPIDGKPKPDGSGAARPMLHAAKLGFAHTDTGEAMSWEVSPPADFAELVKRLR
jgi:23S rRNA pseudouridine1911/1915/1917 synthase